MSMQVQESSCFLARAPSYLLSSAMPDIKEGLSYKNMAKTAVLGYTAMQVALIAAIALKYAAIAGALYLVYNHYQKNSAIRSFEAQARSSADLPAKLASLEAVIQRLGVKLSSSSLENLTGAAASLTQENTKLTQQNENLKAELTQLKEQLRIAQQMSSILSGGFASSGFVQ